MEELIASTAHDREQLEQRATVLQRMLSLTLEVAAGKEREERLIRALLDERTRRRTRSPVRSPHRSPAAAKLGADRKPPRAGHEAAHGDEDAEERRVGELRAPVPLATPAKLSVTRPGVLPVSRRAGDRGRPRTRGALTRPGLEIVSPDIRSRPHRASLSPSSSVADSVELEDDTASVVHARAPRPPRRSVVEEEEGLEDAPVPLEPAPARAPAIPESAAVKELSNPLARPSPKLPAAAPSRTHPAPTVSASRAGASRSFPTFTPAKPSGVAAHPKQAPSGTLPPTPSARRRSKTPSLPASSAPKSSAPPASLPVVVAPAVAAEGPALRSPVIAIVPPPPASDPREDSALRGIDSLLHELEIPRDQFLIDPRNLVALVLRSPVTMTPSPPRPAPRIPDGPTTSPATRSDEALPVLAPSAYVAHPPRAPEELRRLHESRKPRGEAAGAKKGAKKGARPAARRPRDPPRSRKPEHASPYSLTAAELMRYDAATRHKHHLERFPRELEPADDESGEPRQRDSAQRDFAQRGSAQRGRHSVDRLEAPEERARRAWDASQPGREARAREHRSTRPSHDALAPGEPLPPAPARRSRASVHHLAPLVDPGLRRKSPASSLEATLSRLGDLLSPDAMVRLGEPRPGAVDGSTGNSMPLTVLLPKHSVHEFLSPASKSRSDADAHSSTHTEHRKKPSPPPRELRDLPPFFVVDDAGDAPGPPAELPLERPTHRPTPRQSQDSPLKRPPSLESPSCDVVLPATAPRNSPPALTASLPRAELVSNSSPAPSETASQIPSLAPSARRGPWFVVELQIDPLRTESLPFFRGDLPASAARAFIREHGLDAELEPQIVHLIESLRREQETREQRRQRKKPAAADGARSGATDTPSSHKTGGADSAALRDESSRTSESTATRSASSSPTVGAVATDRVDHDALTSTPAPPNPLLSLSSIAALETEVRLDLEVEPGRWAELTVEPGEHARAAAKRFVHDEGLHPWLVAHIESLIRKARRKLRHGGGGLGSTARRRRSLEPAVPEEAGEDEDESSKGDHRPSAAGPATESAATGSERPAEGTGNEG